MCDGISLGHRLRNFKVTYRRVSLPGADGPIRTDGHASNFVCCHEDDMEHDRTLEMQNRSSARTARRVLFLL